MPFVAVGYAVLENATIPIVGEGKNEPNDTYVEQLVASAKAAIDEGVRLGVVDRDRVAVMGHSYGAFMTANLLAHSDLFKAGIARSGAYNRTLTPFGFQNEDRTYWQAPQIYYQMSPTVAILFISSADSRRSLPCFGLRGSLSHRWGVVQLVGHLTVNEDGEGSNPSAPANFFSADDIRKTNRSGKTPNGEMKEKS